MKSGLRVVQLKKECKKGSDSPWESKINYHMARSVPRRKDNMVDRCSKLEYNIIVFIVIGGECISRPKR